VASRIVAHSHRSLADLGQGQAAFANTCLRDRRVYHEVGWAEGDLAIQPFLASVNPLENSCNSQEFERAAHRESFVRAMSRACSCYGIEDSNTKPTPNLFFHLRERCLQSAQRIVRTSQAGLHHETANR